VRGEPPTKAPSNWMSHCCVRAPLAWILEYLDAGVGVVGVFNPDRNTLRLYEGDQPVHILSEHDELISPELLGDFRVAVGRFFD